MLDSPVQEAWPGIGQEQLERPEVEIDISEEGVEKEEEWGPGADRGHRPGPVNPDK